MKRDAFEQVIRSVFAAKEREIVCSEFFESLPRYVDLELCGQDPSAILPQVTQHLGQCPECKEVYLALLQAARSDSEPGNP